MIGGGYYVVSGQLSITAVLASIPYGLGVASILIGKHIDQREFDLAAGERTLPVRLGEARSRRLNQAAVATMYIVVLVLVATGQLTPFALLVLLAAPRALRALTTMERPHPTTAPAGYVGWPLWYHRACLVHNRLFGWAYLAGLALGAALPHARF